MLELKNINVVKFLYKLKLARSNEFAVSVDPKTVSFFTDGSCIDNGKKNAVGGFAVIGVTGYMRNIIILGKVDNTRTRATNIRAEALAILKVLELLVRDIELPLWNKCMIYTDSEFWQKMLYEYMPRWNKSKFKSMSNSDITIPMWNLWNTILENKSIEVVHVYAHNKDNSAKSRDPFKRFSFENNDLADELAGIARDLPDFNVVEEIV